jgi:5-methylcytosine-specific restriction endonuclease McrA
MSRLAKEQSDLVKRGQGWKCRKCGKSIKSGGHIHHKDGNSKNNKISNLVAICAKCHREIPTKKGEEPIWRRWERGHI